jgi:hypothetical protein
VAEDGCGAEAASEFVVVNARGCSPVGSSVYGASGSRLRAPEPVKRPFASHRQKIPQLAVLLIRPATRTRTRPGTVPTTSWAGLSILSPGTPRAAGAVGRPLHEPNLRHQPRPLGSDEIRGQWLPLFHPLTRREWAKWLCEAMRLSLLERARLQTTSATGQCRSCGSRSVSTSDWLFDVLQDGLRALATLMATTGTSCRATSNLQALPQLREEFAHAIKAHDAVIDGEIVAWMRLGAATSSLLFRREWPYFYAFDLRAVDGEDLRECRP